MSLGLERLRTTAVEYKHKYLNRQYISLRKKFLLYSIDMTASSKEPPSVTSGLGVSVQPAKPASSIKILCEELPKVYVFSVHKIFTIFCVTFPNRISRFKILVMP